MSTDIVIFAAFCIFMLLLGARIRQRFLEKKEGQGRGNDGKQLRKNQRPKMAASLENKEENGGENDGEPLEVKVRRIRREKRIRTVTFIQFFLLFGLLIFMFTTLVKDNPFTHVTQEGDLPNFFLRCLILIFAVYLFIISYIKLFRKRGIKPSI
ncbi:hypothetical protein FACS1894199_10760 [Bacteroidia bacterium]|nr:hypothetical protein FACS1894199_10760 [Bacteroidia bacterium]